ncbi:HepT-like ribonuclease domain-containing protein [Telluribacter humicola]|uniref:HepT-like ribonuclease domain-containing protein n=1 Tax=Telluribacter humicola TaxID=1720261 RepID=UPI001A96D046|nr:HepT-like ribonuclease domain-containing protein [Telluribacter humicola]
MTEEVKKYLYDVLLAIEQFLVGIEKFEDYQNDLKTKSAVERQLSIVGGAVNKYGKASTEKLSHSEQIVAVRNRLIHAYDAIDDTIIWVIVQKYLLILKSEVKEKLSR